MSFEPTADLSDVPKSSAGRWFVFNDRNQLLVVDEAVPVVDGWEAGLLSQHLLGVEKSEIDPGEMEQPIARPVWAARCSEKLPIPAGSQFVGLRDTFAILNESDWMMAGRASQILSWTTDHAYCGRCGNATKPKKDERALNCSECELLFFPRLTPAVIMLLERADGQAVLA